MLSFTRDDLTNCPLCPLFTHQNWPEGHADVPRGESRVRRERRMKHEASKRGRERDQVHHCHQYNHNNHRLHNWKVWFLSRLYRWIETRHNGAPLREKERVWGRRDEEASRGNEARRGRKEREEEEEEREGKRESEERTWRRKRITRRGRRWVRLKRERREKTRRTIDLIPDLGTPRKEETNDTKQTRTRSAFIFSVTSFRHFLVLLLSFCLSHLIASTTCTVIISPLHFHPIDHFFLYLLSWPFSRFSLIFLPLSSLANDIERRIRKARKGPTWFNWFDRWWGSLSVFFTISSELCSLCTYRILSLAFA